MLTWRPTVGTAAPPVGLMKTTLKVSLPSYNAHSQRLAKTVICLLVSSGPKLRPPEAGDVVAGSGGRKPIARGVMDGDRVCGRSRLDDGEGHSCPGPLVHDVNAFSEFQRLGVARDANLRGSECA